MKRDKKIKQQKENQNSDKVIVIDINLTGGLAIVLLAVLLVAATQEGTSHSESR